MNKTNFILGAFTYTLIWGFIVDALIGMFLAFIAIKYKRNMSFLLIAILIITLIIQILIDVTVLKYGIFGILNEEQKNQVQIKDQVTYVEEYCKINKICSKLESVKDSCANASNIDGCLSIKLNGANYSMCNIDGTLKEPIAKYSLNTNQCLMQELNTNLLKYAPFYEKEQYEIFIKGGFLR